MSGEKMKEENTMTDKKTSDRSRQQIISAVARTGRSIFARFVKTMTRAINGDERR